MCVKHTIAALYKMINFAKLKNSLDLAKTNRNIAKKLILTKITLNNSRKVKIPFRVFVEYKMKYKKVFKIKYCSSLIVSEMF